MKTRNESGIALIGTLLILVLLGALLEGFILSVNSDQQLITIDRDQTTSFYAAMAALEQFTANLGTLFDTNYSPSPAQINAIAATPPVLSNVSYVSPGGGVGSGYQIQYPVDAHGQPLASTSTIPSGPYMGLVGLLTPYTMTVTAHTLGGSEVKMCRNLQTVAVPVFQFGIFSQTDLSFFAGPNFDFGGRVHTNGNLFLAEGDGCTLTLPNKVTAVGEVIREDLSNGWPTSSSYNGTVDVATSTGAFRPLAQNEGSLTGTLGSSQNEPTWTNLSENTYSGNILNGRTGARTMSLPLVSLGATPIDIVRRPVAGEDVANPDLLKQRYFSQVSMRILLSDTMNDITSLPTVTQTNPIQLSGVLADGQIIGASTGTGSYLSPANTSVIDGYIKIEIQLQNQPGAWQDVTAEILHLGVSGQDLTSVCASPYPNSIIRVQRLKDNPTTPACGGTSDQYWPNVLYDTREGILRNTISTSQYNVYPAGVMHYVELDINNLGRWFTGAIGASGPLAMNTTGYSVYFSDRRLNRNALGQETGEYGFEDVVNSSDPTNGLPNGLLEPAEDVNGNGILDVYGGTPIPPPGAMAPLDNTATLYTTLITSSQARRNRPIFFRRALKLINGSSINLGLGGNNIPLGLAIVSENPAYVQGDYNVTGGNFNGAHVACSLIADAVTLLSNSWNDHYSFNCPHTTSTTCNGSKTGRAATTTSYRMAVIAGKGISFQHPAGRYQDFGTDGGMHNFLRFLENWSGQTLNYRGSIISLFYNRQAVGTYKCGDNDNVYDPPTRGYNFDVEFLDPSLLPPLTPRFSDINITGFTRLIQANQ